jgi:hypothetical protein
MSPLGPRRRVTVSELLAPNAAAEKLNDPTSWLIITGWTATAAERRRIED